MDDISFEFAGFTLTPQRRSLEFNGDHIKLGSREFDILLALVEREGEVLTNADILRIVWPNERVGEAIVRVRVALLRKALGEPGLAKRLIATVVGGGYTFLGGAIRRSNPTVGRLASKARIPAAVSKIFGRDLTVSQIEKAVRRQRLITVVGPGGVGKTTVALEVCRRVSAEFEGIFIVDLATVRDGSSVSTEVALALGIGLHPIDPIFGIIAFLRDRKVMIVFDTCEHVLPAVAILCSRLLESLRHVTTMCTSREPLDVRGETMFRLDPLDNPAETATIATEEIERYPAIQLFVDRAEANSNAFELTEDNIRDVATLCRWLEGIPLAIEFAAARIHEFGLAGVLSRLEYRFVLLNKGRRTASSRHRSLRETLQWSYLLLAGEEAKVFRALSCFAGNFSFSSAMAVTTGDAADVQEALDGLVSKSLVIKTVSVTDSHFRMLDMTRDFARDALAEQGEAAALSELHALDTLRVVREAETAWARGVSEEEASTFAQRLGDVRTALEWCFSDVGDPTLAIKLAADASIAFTPRGLMTEYRRWLDLAIEHNARATQPDRSLDAKLFASLGTALHHAGGPELKDQAEKAFVESAMASREVGDNAGEMRAWSAVSAVLVVSGDYRAAVDLDERFRQIPGGEGSFVEHRTMAHSRLYNGDLQAAGVHMDAVFGSESHGGSRRTQGSVFDQRHVILRSSQALRLYLIGKPDQALDVVASCIEDANSAGHAVALTHTLATTGVPLSVFVGDREQASSHLSALVDVTTTQSILQWKGWANAYEVALASQDSNGNNFPAQRADKLASMTMGGMLAEYITLVGNDAIDHRLLDRALASSPGWCLAELYRLRGIQKLARGLRNEAEAEFELALDTAKRLGTMPWALRAAISLAEIRMIDNDRSGAKAVLEPMVADTTEGFKTADFRRASTLLEEID
ncbi:winged helix-turn-helix domain-containing protein [Rhizobium sp. S152]|uniref:ATP-binding protein n=1 Tax=Rhizobium sp. S152 TaxID=3055038 RepID=UPI0025A9AE16|nr:winged helix-turn-helix domain-containing protein [Rhizobium sp. S152]MDM9628497.1 winged helix-turn-helix domain-containing protein [Rhizobium sp. S152]